MADPMSRPRGSGIASQVYIENGINYIYGYRSVFIRPHDAVQSHSVHSAALSRQGATEVDVDISGAALAASNGQPYTINIFAEELCFVTGTTFTMPGISLNLHCRKLVILPSSDASQAQTPVIFDLSGPDAIEASGKPPAAAEGKAAIAPGLHSFEHHLDFMMKIMLSPFLGDIDMVHEAKYNQDAGPPSPASQGTVGQNGNPGARGGKAGIFQLFVEELENETVVGGKVMLIRANGGKGARGQDGQDGGNGGTGLNWTLPQPGWPNCKNFTDPAIIKCFPGAMGGAGGFGGPGGRGGEAGHVEIRGPVSSGVDAILSVETSVGASGPLGAQGLPGREGSFSQSSFFKPAKQMPFKWGFTVDNMANDPEGQHAWWATKAWWENGQTPAERVTANPQALDEEQLWNIVPEDKRQLAAAPPTAPIFVSMPLKEVQEHYVRQPMLLMNILQRLEFQNFILCTCQPYEAPAGDSNGDEKAIAAFKDSREWLMNLFYVTFPAPELEEAEDPLKWARASLAVLARKNKHLLDAYNNTLTTVPLGIISQRDIENAITAFDVVENLYLEMTGQKSAAIRDRNILCDKIQATGKQLRNLSQAHDDQWKKLEVIAGKIKAAIQKEEDAKKELKLEMESLEGEIKMVVGCDPSRVLEACSTVLMFVDPSHAYRARMGGNLSISTSFGHMVNEGMTTMATAGGGRIEKEYLIDRLSIYSSSADTLKDDLRTALDQTEEAKSKQQDYLAQLQVDEDRFNSMCDQYLAKMKGADMVKAKFKNLRRTVQAKQVLISEYNQIVTGIAEMEIRTQNERAIQTSLQNQIGSVSDESLQAVAVFMTDAYNQVGKSAVKIVYSMLRAFNCVSFQYSSVLSLFRSLHCFTDITAQLLNVAVKTELTRDFLNLFQKWASRAAVVETISLMITQADYPTVLNTLRDTRLFDFDLDWQTAQNFGFDPSWWDIRLQESEVYLHGATAPGGVVRMKTSNTGTFRFYDQEGKQHIFELDPTIRPFAYKNAEDGESFKPTLEPVQGETFALSFDREAHPKVFLQSPLTGWTVEPSSVVDLSKVDKVELRLKLHYRS